jgi:hypothetical protein
MNIPPRILFFLFLLAGAGFPLAAHAGKATSPFTKIKDPTISAITGVSITVTHQRDKASKITTAKNTSQTVTVTYDITPMTDIEVDGRTADLSKLHVGMAVQISADPPSSLDPADPSRGGEARMILAREAPLPDSTPSKPKKK